MTTGGPSAVEVARVVASAVASTPGVAGLHGGSAGEVATYGANARVDGVRIRTRPARRVSVQVVARYGRPLDALADDVRRRVEAALADVLEDGSSVPVDVHVADVRVEQGMLPGSASPSPDADRGAPSGGPGAARSAPPEWPDDGGRS